jgi:hypothetical protein
MLPFWAAVLLGFAAVARVTRFITADALAEPFRDWVQLKTGDGKLTYLVSCPWCASIYVALPAALVVVLTMSGYAGWQAVFLVGTLWLGYSYTYGLLANNLDGDE